MPHWSLPRGALSAQIMVRLAGEYGISPARCTADTGLSHDDLVDPLREISGQQELAVLRNILRLLHPSVPFGYLAGLRYHLPSHGMLGFAIMCSPNGHEAINVAERYFDLSFSFNRLSFEVSGRQGRLIYDDCDNPDDLRAVLVERDVGALITFERDTLNDIIPAQSLEFRGPRPPYPDPFGPLFGVQARYGAPCNCIGFDLAALTVQSRLADERGFRLSEDQCRIQLEQRGNRSGVAGRVHSRIVRTLGEFPSMQVVAAELGMSTRTLRNRLAREGTSYRELIEQAREMVAEELLASDMTVDAIADRLGYTDASSFVAAFKRWKGVPPRRYREETHSRQAR